MRKETTAILDRKENGGMHCQRAYRNIKAMFEGHGYSAPRLYHIILKDEGLTDAPLVERFQKGVKALCRTLRQNNMENRWRAALERDKVKGLHFHVFLLVESRLFNPDAIINGRATRQKMANKRLTMPLGMILQKLGLSFHLSKPQSPLHYVGGVKKDYSKVGQQRFARPTQGPKLDDCLEWISYLVKARSKPDDITHIYFSSRDSKHPSAPKQSKMIDVPPAPEETVECLIA